MLSLFISFALSLSVQLWIVAVLERCMQQYIRTYMYIYGCRDFLLIYNFWRHGVHSLFYHYIVRIQHGVMVQLRVGHSLLFAFGLFSTVSLSLKNLEHICSIIVTST